MTKYPMTRKAGMTKLEKRRVAAGGFRHWDFGLRHSFVIRHSSFVISP
jgi:hypothetical protein